MARILSAKDKAFAEKLNKERRNTDMWRSACTVKDKEIEALKAEVVHLKSVVAAFESHRHMTYEEFMDHINCERRATDALKKLTTLPNALGMGLY